MQWVVKPRIRAQKAVVPLEKKIVLGPKELWSGFFVKLVKGGIIALVSMLTVKRPMMRTLFSSANSANLKKKR